MSLYDWHILELQNADALRAEMHQIGAESSVPGDWNDRATRAVKIERLLPKLARFLYQEMMMEGGAVMLPTRMDDRSAEPVDVLMFGTPRQVRHLLVRLRTQNEDELNLLADELARALAL